MTYVKVSVPKPGLNKGAGGDKKDQITLFDFDDVATMPARDDNGIVIEDDIVMNSGAYMIQLYATKESIKITQETEGDEDAEGFMQSLEFSHPGSEDEIEEFLQNWVSRNVGAIVESCTTGKKKLLGTPCAPLRMKPSSVDDKDMNKTTIVLAMKQKSPYRIANYQGTTTLASVTDTVAADATTIDLSEGSGRYQLTTGSASSVEITTCSNATDGLVFTLLGSGGTYPPKIVDGDDFILASGTTWNATSGKEITFKAFKNGAATYVFIEQSRK